METPKIPQEKNTSIIDEVLKHKFICPSCGHELKQGEYKFNKNTGEVRVDYCLECGEAYTLADCADNLLYEVETRYNSGITKTEIITAASESLMWYYYDRHHNTSKIESSAIVDVWIP